MERKKKIEKYTEEANSLVCKRTHRKEVTVAGIVVLAMSIITFILAIAEFLAPLNVLLFIGFGAVGIYALCSKEPSKEQVNENIQRKAELLKMIKELRENTHE